MPEEAPVLVEKPWGYEYLLFANEEVGLWYLHLKQGAKTSLHCHPRKKTGLVLLEGNAEIHFLNDSHALTALSRTIIRPGLFHSTHSLSEGGIFLLEVETPRDKENLVRLEDSYGREDKPYEGKEYTKPLPDSFLRLATPPLDQPIHFQLNGCTLNLLHTRDTSKWEHLFQQPMLMILGGGLFTQQNEPILTAGDVVTPATWSRLTKNFSIPHGLTLLTISRP